MLSVVLNAESILCKLLQRKKSKVQKDEDEAGEGQNISKEWKQRNQYSLQGH